MTEQNKPQPHETAAPGDIASDGDVIERDGVLYVRKNGEYAAITKTEPAITQAQVDAYLAQQAQARQAEERAIFEELQAWLAERGAAIVAIVQVVDGGAAAVPVWGVALLPPRERQP